MPGGQKGLWRGRIRPATSDVPPLWLSARTLPPTCRCCRARAYTLHPKPLRLLTSGSRLCHRVLPAPAARPRHQGMRSLLILEIRCSRERGVLCVSVTLRLDSDNVVTCRCRCLAAQCLACVMQSDGPSPSSQPGSSHRSAMLAALGSSSHQSPSLGEAAGHDVSQHAVAHKDASACRPDCSATVKQGPCGVPPGG